MVNSVSEARAELRSQIGTHVAFRGSGQTLVGVLAAINDLVWAVRYETKMAMQSSGQFPQLNTKMTTKTGKKSGGKKGGRRGC